MSAKLKRRWLRPRRVLVIAGAIAIMSAGWQVYAALTAAPGKPLDLAAASRALMERQQHGLQAGLSDAWRAVDRAAEVLRRAEDDLLLPDPATIAVDYTGLADPEAIDYASPEERYQLLRRTRAVIKRFEVDGGGAALSNLPGTQRAVRDISVASGPPGSDHRARCRSLARLCVGRMALALEQDDPALYVRAFEQGLAVGRIQLQQADLIDQLCGSACAQLMLWYARRTLIQESHKLNGHHHALLRAVERQQALLPELWFDIEVQRLESAQVVQNCYTDDGNGKGRAIVSKALAAGVPPPVPGKVGAWIVGKLGGFRVVNLLSVAYPGKRAAYSMVDRFAERQLAFADRPRWERQEAMREFESWAFGISSRHFVVYRWTGASKYMPPLFVIDRYDALQTEFEGVRALCAIELHMSRIRSTELPQSLEELVPATLATMPMDPYSGKPLVYRRTGTGAGNLGFILYSVGWDGEDNDGHQNPDGLDALYSLHGRGYDHVFNVIPAPRQPKLRPAAP